MGMSGLLGPVPVVSGGALDSLADDAGEVGVCVPA
jgi:hypothetical protein